MEGAAVCRGCDMTEQVAVAERAVASKARRLAYGSPGLALVSFVVNPHWLFSIVAVSGGLYAIRLLQSEPQFAQHLASSRQRILLAAIVGVALGTLSMVASIVLPYFRL
jgi:hypothetical protein